VQDYQSLVGFQDPYKGNASADVIVVEFFDPNCPACRAMHPIMKQAVAEHRDDAMFVYKPVPLWGYSVPQIEGLFAAAEQNKFFDMLDAQFARQQRGGLGESGMRAVAQAIGMDADRLIDQIKSGAYRQQVLQQREQAVAAGFTAAPTVLVNGRFVSNQSRTPRCMSAFIEAAKAEG
jgi:protein-disulfide isomerase